MSYELESVDVNFFVIEGIDGVGKSTVAEMVSNKLRSAGYNVLLTHEPNDSEILSDKLGISLRDVAKHLNKIDNTAALLQMVVCRRLHILEMIQWIKEQKHKESGRPNIIICDRYVASTYAYNMRNNLACDVIVKLQQLVASHYMNGTYVPDEFDIYPTKTFYLTLNDEERVNRMKDSDIHQNDLLCVTTERRQEILKNYEYWFSDVWDDDEYFSHYENNDSEETTNRIVKDIENVVQNKIKEMFNEQTD